MAGLVKQLALVAVLGAAGAAGWRLWSEDAAPAQEASEQRRAAPGVVVAPVALDRVERSVSAVGAAKPVRSVRLAPSAAGRVVEVTVEGGESVDEGDLILRLDDARERAAVDDARAELARARAAFDRARTLEAQGRLPQNAFETAEADLAAAEAELAVAEKALADRELQAPFGGVVGFRSVDAGSIVGSGDTVATLDDISALDLDFAVPERFFGEVRIGAPVRATTEIYLGEVFSGEVTGLDRRIDTVSRSFAVRARIPNPDFRLPAGAFMRVTLVLESRRGVIAPEEAVVAEGGETFVYVVLDERAERRAVTLGQRLPGQVEVVDGLEPGEFVVTRGLQKARDGAPVRIIETERVESSPPEAREGDPSSEQEARS